MALTSACFSPPGADRDLEHSLELFAVSDIWESLSANAAVRMPAIGEPLEIMAEVRNFEDGMHAPDSDFQSLFDVFLSD